MHQKYYFYYDESEHSRLINRKTISDTAYYDNFITVSVGWNKSNDKDIEERYVNFENKYEQRKSKGELKSKTLKPKEFENGLASLKKDNMDLINDYLDIYDNKIFLYFSITSKIEYIINQLFINYHSNIFGNIELMKYSIIKSILLYQPKAIIDGIYNSSGELIPLLKKFYQERITLNMNNIQLKKYENESYSRILALLNEINEDIDINWNYKIAFSGFIKYVKEKEIIDFDLFIDKEGSDENTLIAAKKMGILNVYDIDSKACFGVRISDIMAGILSKLLKALHKALKYKDPSEFYERKLLSGRWFNLNEHQFLLYKKLKRVLIDLNIAWYKSYSGIYADDLICLVVLIKYIDGYDTFKDFNKTNITMHMENYNTSCCNALEDHYMKWNSKLPITLINNSDQEFYLNQRGAKVFKEISKNPMINISDGDIYHVLSVGFFKERIPNITIEINSEILCYRLPIDLIDWALSCVGKASIGINDFPSDVLFSHKDDKYYTEIL